MSHFFSGILIISFSFSTLLFASEQTDREWKDELTQKKLSIENQSYCYTDEFGKLQGQNVDLRVRLASVSKLVTSLWASEQLGLDHRFETKLFIKENQLHIKGSYDPFMGNEKLFFLLSQLNQLGYKKFDTISFDKAFVVFPNVHHEIDQYPLITKESIIKNVIEYFNPLSWSQELRDEYTYFYSISPQGRFLKDVEFEVKRVSYSERNPLENDPQVRVLTLASPPLFKYLKETNVKSNNFVAEALFRFLGGKKKFDEFLDLNFGLNKEQIQFFSGSGLPEVLNGVRVDNYATCSVVMDLIYELKRIVEMQKYKLEDVVAVPGSDKGTFRNRIFPADYKNAFVAKTGTLYHTSTLAGAMNTQKGFSFFGIFNQSTDIPGAKLVQNAMVKSIMTELGGPLTFDYKVDIFYSYKNDSISNMFLPSIYDQGFSSIGENLY